MSTAEATELTDVLNRVKTWPTTLRITLAREILESLDKAEAEGPPHRPPRRHADYRRRKSAAWFKTDRPPPDDETVKRWIDEHRMEKYGS